jgi:hypothetical protein
MAEVTIMPLIFFTIFYFFLVMLGIEPRPLHMLGRHSPIELLPQPQILLLVFILALLGLNSGLSACKVALYCLSHIIISNWRGLGQNPLLF